MSVSTVVVSTTNQIAGWKILAHVDFISAHVVAGTSIFRDVLAGLTDVVGGRSVIYEEKLVQIDREVIARLKEQAVELSANGIIGLRVDHDSVSGGGKSMLMVTASGTAVLAEPVSEEAVEVLKESGITDTRLIGDQWRCRCGHYNPKDSENCSTCGRSIDAVI